MPQFNNKFIGYEHPNDSLLKQNVYYKYNNLGHRCKNVEEINLDNYILFAGCSHTFGEALNVEDTYPYLTAQKLNCDYYNLGVPATGFDVLFYNVMLWYSLYKPPKLLVIQYPDYTRFSCSVNNSPLIVPYGPWQTDKEIIEMIIRNEDKGFYAFRNLCYTQLLNNLKTSTIKLVFGQTKMIDSDSIRIHRLDYAIDDQHHGTDTHSFVAETIFNKYANTIT